MVQDQLVEYVSSQMKLGVARDTIKAALTGAGWAAADVEDTLKKVEGAGKQAAAPATAFTMGVGVGSAAGTAVGAASASPKNGPSMMSMGPKIGEPQSIKVSDLVSSSASSGKVSPKMPATSTGASVGMGVGAPKKAGSTMKIIGIVAIVILAGLAGFLYYENTSLAGQVATLGTTSSDVSSRLATLNSQVTALDASNTALDAEVASLTAQNTELTTNLSFAAVPPISGGPEASGTVTLSGTLTGGKSSFALTTKYGVVAYVANTKDAAIVAALTPLLTSSSSVTLTGTHTLGSQYLTVTAVNGSAVQ